LSRRIARGSNMPSLTVHGALRAVISLPMLWAPLMITAVTFAAPAAAQETPAEHAPLQQRVLTGIRRGIADAIKVKEDSGRSIEFDQYPSELLSSVVVYKTPDARLIGQGLAGTIELRTMRPLEYGRRAVAFNVRGERNSNSSLGADSTDKGYRASFSYIDQYADNKVGLTFGLARLNSPLTTEGYGTYE